MQTNPPLKDIGDFLGEYAAYLMGCGVHTSRVIRNTKRIGNSFNLNVRISVFLKTITISISDEEENHVYSKLVEVTENPILFSQTSSLSALSWEAYDCKLPLDELKEKFEILKKAPRLHPNFILIMASLANMSFCKIFGGDLLAMTIVFIATMVGFFLKQKLTKWKCNHYITIILSAFSASLVTSISLYMDTTSGIAIATSVLYLIPGVPLVNSIIDIIEGYTLVGITRLINATLTIIFIAIGLGVSLILFTNSLL